MTRDDIIRMAKEAGWKRVGHNPETGPEFPVLIGNFERFAALVAAEKDKEIAALREEIAALKEERRSDMFEIRSLRESEESLREENERLRADAERYQWLKVRVEDYDGMVRTICQLDKEGLV